MRFSIYSEMQLWPGKSPERLYAEVEEQIVHADRLGYDAYAIVEHFFPEIAITANPGGFAHWQAIKTQEIFADEVAPRFRSSDPTAAGAAPEVATPA